MKEEKRRREILKEMTRIDCMEKGRLTEEYRERYKGGKKVRLGPYYKHQRWEDGRNMSRRVSVAEVERMRKAVDGYHQFEKLAKEYAQITIQMTRQSKADEDSKKKPR
ncbi:MAG: hypothetical protein GY797_36485 [Deltaproteobacteria bacterium]|nr:hypothetical protein [Deltaproteobacteria bacterium]